MDKQPINALEIGFMSEIEKGIQDVLNSTEFSKLRQFLDKGSFDLGVKLDAKYESSNIWEHIFADARVRLRLDDLRNAGVSVGLSGQINQPRELRLTRNHG
jgi:hypothetical protein